MLRVPNVSPLPYLHTFLPVTRWDFVIRSKLFVGRQSPAACGIRLFVGATENPRGSVNVNTTSVSPHR